MFSSLLQFETLLKIFLNTIFVSIPEETFLVMFTLALSGQFDFLETDLETERRFYKKDIINIAIPVIMTALLSNIFKYSGVDFLIFLPILILVMFLSIATIYKLWNYPKEFGKVFIFLIISFFTIAIIEISYIPFVLYSTGKTVNELNNDLLLNSLLSIPERLIEIVIIVFLLTRKTTPLKANFLKPILNNKVLTALTSIICIFDFTLLILLCKAIGYNKILNTLPFTMQLIIISGTVIFPIINISVLLWGLYYKENKIRISQNKQMETLEMINYYIYETMMYTKDGKYDKINSNLKALQLEINTLKQN